MANETFTEVYRLHVWIFRISLMIWRRLLVRSDSPIADLHYTLQTALGWSDQHLLGFPPINRSSTKGDYAPACNIDSN